MNEDLESTIILCQFFGRRKSRESRHGERVGRSAVGRWAGRRMTGPRTARHTATVFPSTDRDVRTPGVIPWAGRHAGTCLGSRSAGGALFAILPRSVTGTKITSRSVIITS